jgi:hypothetical protein
MCWRVQRTEPACGSSISLFGDPRVGVVAGPGVAFARGGSKVEVRPGVWKLSVSAGRFDDGSVRRVHRTVRAGTAAKSARLLAEFVASIEYMRRGSVIKARPSRARGDVLHRGAAALAVITRPTTGTRGLCCS